MARENEERKISPALLIVAGLGGLGLAAVLGLTLAQAAPKGITFQAGVAGTPAGWEGYDRWMCAYYDPGIGDFIGDQEWHDIYEYITFSDVQSGGYFAAWVLRTSDPSVLSPQYTSGPFYSADGRKYLFNIVELKVYEVA
jgi:hypothetical protein